MGTDIAALNIKVTNTGVQENAVGLRGLKTEATGAKVAVKEFEDVAKRAGQSTSAFTRVIESSIFTVKNLVGTYALLKAINMADTFILLEGRVRTSTKSVEESDYAWKSLLATAKQTGGDLGASIEIFQRISFVRDEIKATTNEMLQFTETVTKLGIVSGASQDALKFGLTQLGQSLSSNIVRAEEFNSIMENIPAVGKAIADQFGVTTGQLRNLVINGKVLSADVFAAILNESEKVRKDFDAYPVTVARAFGMFKVYLTEAIGSLNETEGASGLLIAVLVKGGQAALFIGQNIQTMILAFKSLFTDLVSGVTGAIIVMLGAIEKLVNAGINAKNYFTKNKTAQVDLNFGLDTPVDTRDPASTSYKQKMEFLEQNDPMTMARNEATSAANAKTDASNAKAGTQGRVLFGFAPEDSANHETATRKISQDYEKMAESADKAQQKAQKAITKTIADLVFQNEQMGRTNKEQEVYNELRKANVDIDSAAGQKIAELARLHYDLSQQQKAVNSAVEAGEGAFKKLWTGAITGANDWKSTMKGILSDVGDMFYDLAIKTNVQNLLKSAFGQPTDTGGAGGGIGSLLSGIDLSGAGDWISNLFHFADGGSFNVGGQGGTDSQLVQFMASPDENVHITKPGQSMGGGGDNHWHIDARGADAGVEERVMRAVIAVSKSIEPRSLNAVNNQLKRNPTYGRRT